MQSCSLTSFYAVAKPSDIKILLDMNKEKYIHHQQQNWLSDATNFNVATAPASNHRLELLADNADAAKFAEHSHIFI